MRSSDSARPKTNSEVLDEETRLDPEHEAMFVPVLLRMLDTSHTSSDEFLLLQPIWPPCLNRSIT